MTSAHPKKPSERVADSFMTGVDCTVSPVTKADLLADLERLSREAKELVSKVHKAEEKQSLLDASLYLQRSISCARRVKERLGEV